MPRPPKKQGNSVRNGWASLPAAAFKVDRLPTRMHTRPPYDLDVNRSMRVIPGICMNVTDIADTAPLCCVRVAALGLDRTPGQVLACAFCAMPRDNIDEQYVLGE